MSKNNHLKMLKNKALPKLVLIVFFVNCLLSRRETSFLVFQQVVKINHLLASCTNIPYLITFSMMTKRNDHKT